MAAAFDSQITSLELHWVGEPGPLVQTMNTRNLEHRQLVAQLANVLQSRFGLSFTFWPSFAIVDVATLPYFLAQADRTRAFAS